MRATSMDARRLDRRITIRERVGTPDGAGGETVTWTARATVYADRRDVSAREQMLSQQMVATGSVVFRIRYRSDVVLTDSILCDGISYDIQSIAEIGRREGLEILAKLP
jgi:SPP1 family predicted phage head-tail adaptor